MVRGLSLFLNPLQCLVAVGMAMGPCLMDSQEGLLLDRPF